MIYITGDPHGELSHFSEAILSGESKWTAADTLIVCGDFGFIWANPENEADYAYDQAQLDALAKKPYQILFVDGNHENFDVLYRYPLEDGFGGTVRRIRDNIFHLQRGQVYTIGGYTFFAFGGGYSMDKYLRRKGLSWWPQELPTAEELEVGRQTLAQVGNRVDFIVTHTAPHVIVKMIRYTPDPHERPLNVYFNNVWRDTQFERWFFGHFHEQRERPVAGRAVPLYKNAAAIPEREV